MDEQFQEKFKKHLKEFQTAPFLFVGSGLSRRYLNLENWEGLLKKFSNHTGKSFEYYLSANNGSFSKIASNIAEDFFDIWWQKPEYQRNRDIYKNCINDRKSPLKIEISSYFANLKDKLTKDSNLLHEIDLLRDSVIDGIITTNWDQFLENIFKDFVTYIGQEELIFSPSQGIGEIYKIHGCCSNPNSLVLTESDYLDFDKKNAYLAAKLITIFTEHPIIFIGYSLNDDNINQILKSIVNCLSDKNVSRIQNRLIFVTFNKNIENPIIYGSHKTYDNYQIPITTIETNGFIEVFNVLKNLKRKIPAKILRKLKKQVYDFVISSEAREKLYVMDINEADDSDNLEVVYGVGIKNRIKESSYIGFGREELYEDIVFDNKNFESEKIIKLSLSKIIRQTIKNSESVPIFKYLKAQNFITDSGSLIFRNAIKSIDEDGNEILEERIPKKVIKLFDDITSDREKYFYPPENYVKNFPKIKIDNLLSIDDFIEKNGIYDFMKYFVLFYPKIGLDEIQKFIFQNYDRLLHSENGFESSQFKKMICWYDYLSNYVERKV